MLKKRKEIDKGLMKKSNGKKNMQKFKRKKQKLEEKKIKKLLKKSKNSEKSFLTCKKKKQ